MPKDTTRPSPDNAARPFHWSSDNEGTMMLQRAACAVFVLGCAGPAGAASLCANNEDVLYSCNTRGKMIAICASKDLAVKHGYIQYRFGTPAKVEISVPTETPIPSVAGTNANTLMFSGGGGAYIRFKAADYEYVVYTAIGRGWGEKDGVAIEHKGKPVTHISCVDVPVSKLGQDLFDKAGLKTDPVDFVLP